jgi:hypothetical protein
MLSMQAAFSDCTGLTKVTIPDSVTSIITAFSGCTGLTSMTIPSSVNLLDDAFLGCTKLKEIKVDTDNPYFSSADGILFNKDKTRLILHPPNKQGAYTIPNTVTDTRYAFDNCTGLTSVIISSPKTTVAFRYCTALTSATIPDGVTELNASFEGCSALTTVTIPDSVTEIWDYDFKGCTSLYAKTKAAILKINPNARFN